MQRPIYNNSSTVGRISIEEIFLKKINTFFYKFGLPWRCPTGSKSTSEPFITSVIITVVYVGKNAKVMLPTNIKHIYQTQNNINKLTTHYIPANQREGKEQPVDFQHFVNNDLYLNF